MDRLDLLIYAHDGRGLGHASRSVAIGLAVRRLYPERSVLFVSGMKQTASLIGAGRLDWVKLPSYETQVLNGVSKGCHGNSNYSDRELGNIRSGMLQDLVDRLKPRCVLSDHMPQGKHRELLSALEISRRKYDTHWILGLRGVIGDVKGVWSEEAVSLFHRYYRDIFWYGDRAVLGDESVDRIRVHFGCVPVETGYVSRLAEWGDTDSEASPGNAKLAATVSVPWVGEYTLSFLEALAKAVERIGPSSGEWHLFLGRPKGGLEHQDAENHFKKLPHCRLFKPGGGYFPSLKKSQLSIIYGGYNSLTDLLFLKLPGLVVLRDMADQEQQEHIRRLTRFIPDQFRTVTEPNVDADALEAALRSLLKQSRNGFRSVRLNGAERAASLIEQILKEKHG